ncbi:MAG TPA: phosphatidylserine decarboxylase [Thermoplasmata archaeon]
MVGFLAWFFRDPERAPGPDIVSAADGRVVAVDARDGRWQVAVFMNVTDVHVNRFPIDASVERVEDGGSGFRPAYAPDADHNVRRHYHLVTAVGPVEVVQMTGIAARRLVALVRAGERHAKGDRLGMIVLGSRVDVFLPRDRTEVLATLGQRVWAGVTPIARALP